MLLYKRHLCIIKPKGFITCALACLLVNANHNNYLHTGSQIVSIVEWKTGHWGSAMLPPAQ